ncbi:MAG: CHAT domain-containing protein [Candidatus Eiseniibacteriota bacterium]
MQPRPIVAVPLRFGLAAAVLAWILPIPGDSTVRVLDLCRFVSNLDSGFARHLVLDDGPAFRRYCDVVGQIAIRDAFAKVDWKLWSAPPDSYLTRYRALSPHLERMAAELATLYGSAEYSQVLEVRRALGAEGVGLNRLFEEYRRLLNDESIPTDMKMAGLRRLQAEYERIGFGHGVIQVEGALARLAGLEGDSKGRAAFLHSALTRARGLGEIVMICQLLGEIGYEHGRAGCLDSMLTCYQEGIAIADRHRLPEQASRMRRFLAGYYVSEGRLAVAAHLAREAQRLCRRWNGGPVELDALLWTMERFAELECWDIVRGLYQRLPVLLRALGRTIHHEEFVIHSLTARRWEARLLVAQGRPAEGAAIMADLRGPVSRTRTPERYGSLLAELAEALVKSGQPREALDVIGEGVAYADSLRLGRAGDRLALTRVRAAFAMGDLELARSACRVARSRLGGREAGADLRRCGLDALDVGMALARGRGREAWQKFEGGLDDLRSTVRRLEVGPQSHLALAQAEDLREVGHRLLAKDASGSYCFELDWRSLPGLLGRTESVPGTRPSTSGRAAILDASGATRAIHVVYGFTADGLTRWTRSWGAVRREVLPLSRVECDRRVEKAMLLLSRDPGSGDTPMPDAVRAACSDLGRLLLPTELRERPGARVVVSADGSIARLPFEVLDIGTGPDYEPLLARHDVVYARPVPPVRRRAGDGTTLILLGAEEAAGEHARPASLMAAEAEAARARARLPNSRVVLSNQIAKQALLDDWSNASVLYVVAHLVRDREAPLLCYFPMTFGARPNRVEDTYLDLFDVRTVDLTGCRLAVLSSCASGEPYVVGGRAGSSMADALIDGGASAVIHTRWQVRDEVAAVVAPRLTEAWLDAARDPVSAWCAARRGMMQGAQGWRHPFEWAAWSVTVGLPTRPWPASDPAVTVAAAAPGPSARDRRAGSGERTGSRP